MPEALLLPVFNSYARSAAISSLGLHLVIDATEDEHPPAGTVVMVGAVAMGRLEQSTGKLFDELIEPLQNDVASRNPYAFGAAIGAKIAAVMTGHGDAKDFPFEIPRIEAVVSTTPYFEVTG